MSCKENFIKLEEEKQEEEFQECLFCFIEVDPNDSFIGCDTCGKHCHLKCYIDWFNKDRTKNKKCISCQQPTLVLSESKVSMLSRCLSLISNKKPKINKKFYKIV